MINRHFEYNIFDIRNCFDVDYVNICVTRIGCVFTLIVCSHTMINHQIDVECIMSRATSGFMETSENKNMKELLLNKYSFELHFYFFQINRFYTIEDTIYTKIFSQQE